MFKTKLAKTNAEQWRDIWCAYQRERPGAFRAEDVVEWAIKNDLAELPRVNPKRVLTDHVKRIMRGLRMHDPQGRKVRTMLAAKVKRHVDENGNLIFDVVWDHIHEMSLDHVFISFDQRDANILKQRKSATRDLQSCLDNNPNVRGHESQFQFEFMLEETERQVVEAIEETKNLGRKKPR